MLVIGFILLSLGCGVFDGRLAMAQDDGRLVCGGGASMLVDDDCLLTDDDSLLSEVPDTLAFGKSLNDIRFAGWTDDDYYDNDYCRMIRAYIDDYNAGKIEAPSQDSYKYYEKGTLVYYYDTLQYYFYI